MAALLANILNRGRIKEYQFFVRFLVCFFLLYLTFPFIRGITGEGGKIYSSFVDEYLNIVKAFTVFLVKVSKAILEFLKFNVLEKNFKTLRISNAAGVVVNPSCLGWGIMSFWIAFVYANKGGVKRKLKWIFVGIGLIVGLNICRIVLMAIAGYRKWSSITNLDHHSTFNFIAYCFVFILIFAFIRNQKKFESSKTITN